MKRRVIVTISGGKASAWCANWALKTYNKHNVVLYFNDTKWEHPDLYRFLNDLSEYFDHPITHDNDGRSPEELFHDNHALADNRMPFCSRILKAERLQAFYRDGDILIFGIGHQEKRRANRIIGAYQIAAAKTNKWPTLRFPLIDERTSRRQIDAFLTTAGIKPPLLYDLGFQHNNCSGGCVRAGKSQWYHLYKMLPEVYAERERVEEDMRTETGRDIHILKDETLQQFRKRIDKGEYKIKKLPRTLFECVGICNTQA